MLNCKRMRTAVLSSALLLVAGLLLEVVAQVTTFAIPTTHLALVLVLSAVLILALTFLASLLPGTAQRLSECRH